jgi:hypothetical protein
MPDTFPAAAPVRRRVISCFTVLVLAFVGVVALAPPAQAAAVGPSYDNGNGHLGAYSVVGVNVYCLEIEKARPLGASTGPVMQGWGALTPLELARVNWAISTHGQSLNPRVAAAVNLYVWSIVDAVEYNSHGMSGDDWFITRATGADIPAIRGNLAAIRSQANAITTVGVDGGGSATLSVQMFDSYDGQVVVSATPASASGVLHLDGAVVAGTDADSAPVQDGSVIPIRGIPLDSQTEEYAITANATFTVSQVGGYYGRIGVYTTGSAQRLGFPGGQAPATYTFDAADYVTDPLELQFEPVITTAVSDAMLQPGEPFVDQLVVGLSPTSPATEWRILTDGSAVEVVARGVLYGPFQAPPQGPGVPVDAPVAWVEYLTLNGTGRYDTSGGFTTGLSGYYTWVWSIDFDDQVGLTPLYMPAGYNWHDSFGQEAETVASAVAIDVSSRVTDPIVGLWQPVSDTLTVTHAPASGPWWSTVGGTPVAARFRGSAYFVRGDVPPTVSAGPPPEAELIGVREFDSIVAPGEYTATVPSLFSEDGYVVWQWELVGDDVGAFVPWRDDFGLPDETTRITAPTLATNADALIPAGGVGTDSALIGGEPTGEPTYLSFSVFRQLDPDSARCDDTTLVNDSIDEPIEVTTPGTYASEPVLFAEIGTYFWIATLRTGEGVVINAGRCGDPGETTQVVPFVVSTEAVELVAPGGAARDVATVAGPTPEGATITFAAYRQDPGMVEPQCQNSNRVFTTQGSPLPLNGPGIYKSAESRLERAGTYLWVETVRTRTGDVLHVGECGASYELTEVQVPTLAVTGASGYEIVGLSCLAVVLSGGLMLWRSSALVVSAIITVRPGKRNSALHRLRRLTRPRSQLGIRKE